MPNVVCASCPQLFLDNDKDGAETSELAHVALFGTKVMATASLSELKKC